MYEYYSVIERKEFAWPNENFPKHSPKVQEAHTWWNALVWGGAGHTGTRPRCVQSEARITLQNWSLWDIETETLGNLFQNQLHRKTPIQYTTNSYMKFRKVVTITLYTRQQKRHFSYFYFLTLLQSPYYCIVVALLTSA